MVSILGTVASSAFGCVKLDSYIQLPGDAQVDYQKPGFSYEIIDRKTGRIVLPNQWLSSQLLRSR